MYEIEKMYEKCNFEKSMGVGSPVVLHPFTAEKQIKLIELFISSTWWENLKSLYRIMDVSLNFDDKLAGIVNYLWISLSEEEKQQIKEILE